MEKVVGDEVCPYVSVDVPKELQPLLKIPYMTRKVAQVLVDKGVQTPEMFVDLEAQVVANYLKLSIGFEVQVLQPSLYVVFSPFCILDFK